MTARTGMKVVVLGAGRMGAAAAYDLAAQSDVARVLIVDREHGRAAQVAKQIGSKAKAVACDLKDGTSIAALMAGAQGVFSAASYSLNTGLTRAAIAARAHFVDLGGNNDVVAEQLELDAAAKAANVTVIPDCGLAPGMAGWLAVRLANRLDRCTALRMRVGGLPSDRPAPLEYRLVFSVEGLINEYKESCLVVRDGVAQHVPALSEIEPLDFPAPFHRLECFHTSGGLSTLPRTLKGRIPAMDYKTIRYPGHAAKIQLLFDLGLADEERVAVDGGVVAPRRVLEACLERRLSGPVDDVVLVRIEADGSRDGRRVTLRNQIIDRLDKGTGHSAMARTTAYPASVALLEAMRGRCTRAGVVPGESALDLDSFFQRVVERGIAIDEVTH